VGVLTELVQSYRDGEITWDELVEKTAHFDYKVPSYKKDQPELGTEAWYDHVERHLFDDNTDTPDELQYAMEQLLSRDEYARLFRDMQNARKGSP